MVIRKDRHRFRSVVNVKLTEEQLITLDLFLPRQEGFQRKARYLCCYSGNCIFQLICQAGSSTWCEKKITPMRALRSACETQKIRK